MTGKIQQSCLSEETDFPKQRRVEKVRISNYGETLLSRNSSGNPWCEKG